MSKIKKFDNKSIEHHWTEKISKALVGKTITKVKKRWMIGCGTKHQSPYNWTIKNGWCLHQMMREMMEVQSQLQSKACLAYQ